MGGEPYTWRRVSTVRRQAVGNLPPKGGTAPTAEPTCNSEATVRGHGQVRRGNPRFETYSLILKQLNNHYHAQYIQAFILHQP